jgi:6-hydroxytryprostatin B O-methyltransferase
MALNSPSLLELASAITSQVSIINEFLQNNGLPQPSFAVDGLRTREFPENPEIQQAYMELVESASDLLHLALGPENYVASVPLQVS